LGFGFAVWDWGLSWGLGFAAWDIGFGVWGLRVRVSAAGRELTLHKRFDFTQDGVFAQESEFKLKVGLKRRFEKRRVVSDCAISLPR